MLEWGPILGGRSNDPQLADQRLLDIWSLIHAFSGWLLYSLGFQPALAFMLLIAFEVIENSGIGFWFFQKVFPQNIPLLSAGQSNYIGDSWGNMMSDIVIGSAVYCAFYYF